MYNIIVLALASLAVAVPQRYGEPHHHGGPGVIIEQPRPIIVEQPRPNVIIERPRPGVIVEPRPIGGLGGLVAGLGSALGSILDVDTEAPEAQPSTQ